MSLRTFIDLFKDQVITVDKEVSPDLEASRILAANESVPVFFENLKGSPAVGNLWSASERICKALDVAPMKLMENMAAAIDNPTDPKMIERAPFMEQRDERFDLRSIPIPQYYAVDGGRYITSGIVIGEYGGVRNLSFHRMMLLNQRQLAIRIVPRHLYALHRKALEDEKDLPIAIAIGLDPSILLPAAMSIGFGVDELRIANTLRKLCLDEQVEAARAGNGIVVPAHSEYILEGRITSKTIDEGPFVDITGTIDNVRKQPVVEIDAINRRTDSIMQLLLPGGPEHRLLMGMPKEPVILQALRRVVPKVIGVHLTIGGCGWLHGVIAIEPQHEGDGKNAGMAALAAHTSMKACVVVNSDIDVYNVEQVEWAIATRFQPHKDLMIIEGARGSSLDPSAGDTTSKMVIDATIKGPDIQSFKRVKP